MSHESGMVLTEICSILQYLEDRGELGASISAPVTAVRWTDKAKHPLDYVDIIGGGRVIRITAEDLGPHVHEFDHGGHCDCGIYKDEDLDEDENADVVPLTPPETPVPRGVQVSAIRFSDLVKMAEANLTQGNKPPSVLDRPSGLDPGGSCRG